MPFDEHPFGTLFNRNLIGYPAESVGDITGMHVVGTGHKIQHLLPDLTIKTDKPPGRLACTVDQDGFVTIATAGKKADFYFTDVTVRELDTSSTGCSVRMPLSGVDQLEISDGPAVRVCPAKVRAFLTPSYGFPVTFGVVTRVVRSHGEVIMREVTTVGVDRNGVMIGPVPRYHIYTNLTARTIDLYANSSRVYLELMKVSK